jgi:hypothetical protein
MSYFIWHAQKRLKNYFVIRIHHEKNTMLFAHALLSLVSTVAAANGTVCENVFNTTCGHADTCTTAQYSGTKWGCCALFSLLLSCFQR